MPDDDLKEEPLVWDELDDDELRDEILPGDAERLADHASFPQETRRLEHGADDRVHPPRLLGDVEHDCGDRFGPRVEYGLHVHVEAPVLRGNPPEDPEGGDDREDRAKQRRADEELNDYENEGGDGQLLRQDGALLEDEIVPPMHARAVDDQRSDQEPDDRKEQCALDEQQDHARSSLDSRRVSQYVVSSDARHVDRDLVWRFLHDDAYWSAGVPRDIVERAIDGSICFSAFDGDPENGAPQVAFARVVTDKATFAWLCDVFVLAEHRGKGIAKQLMDAVMAHPELQGLRNVMLATRDAHGLYARYGFLPLAEPGRWMAIRRPYRS
jgi:GNAT superfamily N-acetyltransferase